MCSRMIAALLGLSLVATAAMGGSIVARDGKAYAGSIQFMADDRVEITPTGGTGGAAVVLAFADVKKLSMAEPAATTVAATAPATAPVAMPAPWQQCDVGQVHVPGDAGEKDGTFTLRGAGWGSWGSGDSFHFVYQNMTGDGDIVARLVDLPSDDNRFVAGVTIREDTKPAAAEVSLMISGTTAWRLNARRAGGASSRQPEASLGDVHWIRLVRAGDWFGGYCSMDGKEWVPLSSANVKMSDTVVVGMGCAAGGNQALATARFSNVSVRHEAAGPGRGLCMVDGSLIAGEVKRFDSKVVQYGDSQRQAHVVPTSAVACIYCGPTPADVLDAFGRKQGVVLGGGDVIEGRVTGMENDKLFVTSVIMGPQVLEWPQARLIVFRPAAAQGSYRVSARDGSRYRCKAVTTIAGGIRLQTAGLGDVNINAADLVAIDSLP